MGSNPPLIPGPPAESRKVESSRIFPWGEFCKALIRVPVGSKPESRFDIIGAMKPNPTRLLNRSAVREKTFALLAEKRPALVAKKTRIGASFYLQIQGHLINSIANYLEAMPSAGKTVR